MLPLTKNTSIYYECLKSQKHLGNFYGQKYANKQKLVSNLKPYFPRESLVNIGKFVCRVLEKNVRYVTK